MLLWASLPAWSISELSQLRARSLLLTRYHHFAHRKYEANSQRHCKATPRTISQRKCQVSVHPLANSVSHMCRLSHAPNTRSCRTVRSCAFLTGWRGIAVGMSLAESQYCLRFHLHLYTQETTIGSCGNGEVLLMLSITVRRQY